MGILGLNRRFVRLAEIMRTPRPGSLRCSFLSSLRRGLSQPTPWQGVAILRLTGNELLTVRHCGLRPRRHARIP